MDWRCSGAARMQTGLDTAEQGSNEGKQMLKRHCRSKLQEVHHVVRRHGSGIGGARMQQGGQVLSQRGDMAVRS